MGRRLMRPWGSAWFQVMVPVISASDPGAVLQIKVRMLGISPLVWRRCLVPESMSLRELHGIVQASSVQLRRQPQDELGKQVQEDDPDDPDGNERQGPHHRIRVA